MKKLFFLAISIFLLSFNLLGQFGFSNNDFLQYFYEIALEQEYGSDGGHIKKWNQDIRIFVMGKQEEYLVNELRKIILELTILVDDISLEIVDNKRDANFYVFFGSNRQFGRLEPRAKSYLRENWGLFWIDWDDSFNIYRASVFVDIYRTRNAEERRHLLREEVTQALGLMNDSYRHADSIFYQKWSTITEYSNLDRVMIAFLYDSDILAGMKRTEVQQIFSSKYYFYP